MVVAAKRGNELPSPLPGRRPLAATTPNRAVNPSPVPVADYTVSRLYRTDDRRGP